ncbi:MAG: pyrroloquinoline quinone-dependent dehydrogenase, partial [Acidobacteriota bacterium]
PQGDVPGEWYSPTQPFPLDAKGRPFNYDRQGFTVDDLLDFTAELRAEALQVASKYKLGPVFTPPVVSKADGPLATLAMMVTGGGTNWPGGSYDPETHIVYVHSRRGAGQLGLVPPRPESKTDVAYVSGNALTGARGAPPPPLPLGAAPPPPEGGRGLNVRGLPLVKPPYGQISAIDLGKGEVIWQVAHGETPDLVRNHPALKGLDIPRTGRNGVIGTLVTKTLLVAGETGFGPTPSGARGALLRAYDKATGKDAGAVYMPAPQTGSPMTYVMHGKQYIVLAIAGPNFPGELIAYRLP